MAASPILQVFRIGEAGVDSGVTWPVSDDPDVSALDDLVISSIPADVDCLIVQWARGQTRVPATGGTSMSIVTTAAKSQAEAYEWGLKALAHQAQPDEYTLKVFPTGDSDIPGVDCLPGDTVHFADGRDGTLDERMVAWKLSFDGDDAAYEVTVKSRQLVEFEAIDRLLNQKGAGLGSLGGQASSQEPDQLPRFAPQAITAEQTIQFSPDALTTAAVDNPIWAPDTDLSESRNLYAASIRVSDPFANDIQFQVWIEGFEMLGGLGVLPAGWTYNILPVFPYGGWTTAWTTAQTTPLKVNVYTTPAVDEAHPGSDIVIKLLFV